MKLCIPFKNDLLFDENRDRWIPDFWYKMWDCTPMTCSQHCFTISWIYKFSVCNLQMGKRKTSEYPTSDTKYGIAHPYFHEFSIRNMYWILAIASRFHEFSVYNLQVRKRDATEYPTSDTICGIDYPPIFSRILNSEYWILAIASRFHDITNFLFIICRWGKERPLNTRLLIQNVGLPTHIFTNSQFGILNFSDSFTISRIFCL